MMNKLNSISSNLWSNKWALSILSGLLLGLSYPPVPFPFLIFPAWILLFRLLELTETNRGAAYWSYISFVIWNLITTYWLMLATVAGGIAAILANSAVMTIPIVFQRQFQKKLKSPWLIALLQAAAWISYEFLHHNWDLAWPWLSLGNAWSNVPGLVQYISLTGYWSISFWVLVTASLAWQAVKTSDRRLALGAVAVVLLFPAVSLVQYYSTSFSSDKKIEAVVAQPNFDTYQTYGGYGNVFDTQQVLYNLSDSVRTDSTDLVLWPENAVRGSLTSREISGSTTLRVKNNLSQRAKEWDLTLITGTTYFEYFYDEKMPPLVRNPETDPFLYYNAALSFYPDQKYEVYRKYNLVPIVERVPFVQFLNAIDILGWVNWRDAQGYGKGTKPQQFRVDGTQTPALVCYDSVFPNWVRQYVSQGSGFISIITNDGWWGNTSGHHQHFAYARLRAIEFRRWIVRSANNGISGIINPHGNIEVKTNYWKKTAFRYDVPVLEEQTLYTRWGDWFPITMVAMTAFGFGLILVRKK
ncbi:apolipoprotein N-acyltransferase [Aliifodinibius sp. S!AR15-10]|uniref:apolipoprotein N-acyltransferase n=1 Tax=Aliifodinibius sp. S!AR15-10 TaxID=2950437 RepID=UPI00285CFDC3|nr:apolipoprotein N-acyltransferase [Aliifodinibius sp. S!AR15-10]MDR8390358.1 apolipoprotein N-acyltransferase [Aliifodinibius sp. S!AR15-10]